MPGNPPLPLAPRRRQTPGRTIQARAAEAIDRQRERMSRSLGSAIDGRDPEGVHDMRVASRRLRAMLGIFAPWLDADEVERASNALRRITRVLGRVRELDVLRLRLSGLAARARPERKIAIEIVDGRLARRRRRARARMMKRFAAIDLDRLDLQLRRLAGVPADPLGSVDAPPHARSQGAHLLGSDEAAPEAAVEELLHRAAPEIAGEAENLVRAQVQGAVGSAEAMQALHRVRILAKKLRYRLELLAPDLGAAGTAGIESLRGLQDRLGDFHDDTVLDDVLRAAIAAQADRGRMLLARELRSLRSVRRRALYRDERACRAALAALGEQGFERDLAEALRSRGLLASLAPGAPGVAVEEAAHAAAAAHGTSETEASDPMSDRAPRPPES